MHGPAIAPQDLIPALVRIERFAELRPDSIAVVQGSVELSFAQLKERSDRLALWLLDCGGGPQVRIALALAPSIRCVVALLAISKINATAVLVDTRAPAHKLATLFERAAPALLVTDTQTQDTLPAAPSFVIDLDRDAPLIDAATGTLDTTARSDLAGLAYIAFTSGTSATPNGVGVTQHNLAASLAARDLFYREPVGRMLALLPMAFDAGLATVYWTLGSGGCLVIPPPDTRADPRPWVALARTHDITHLMCVPAMARAFVECVDARSCTALRSVTVGGEVCPPGLVNDFKRVLPAVQVCNEYGPTEATVWATAHKCSATPGTPGTPGTSGVPIGRPVAGTVTCIVDDAFQPVTAGHVGELCIGGQGVVPGYLDDPTLNAHKFVPDPWRDGETLYRTGDLVRLNSAGELEFVGRADLQAKVHGHRIELEEVESALSALAVVKECAVGVTPTAAGSQLVAHIVLRHGYLDAACLEGLRTGLAQRLVTAAIPGRFVASIRLPRTSTGKLDRAALRVPELGSARQGRKPCSDLEHALLKLWSELLECAVPSIDSDFFELGGYSLLATRMVARLHSAPFCVDLPLSAVFDAPTIHDFAPIVERAQHAISREGADIEQGEQDELATMIAGLPEAEVERLLQELQQEADH